MDNSAEVFIDIYVYHSYCQWWIDTSTERNINVFHILRLAFNKHKKAQQKFSDVQMEQQNMILINLNSRCHKL